MKDARIFYGHLSQSLPFAVSYVKSGGVIAAPTDTVYGFLGLYREDVIKKIHFLKNREDPFLILINDFYYLEQFAEVEPWQQEIVQKLMPGKNTVILKKNKNLSYPKGETIALRMPSPQHNIFLSNLLKKTKALVAPSLNRHGESPLYELAEIDSQFGKQLSGIFIHPHYQKTSASKIWRFENRSLIQVR